MRTEKLINWLKINWILIIILLFASILRLWNLGNIPPHLTPDEASLGYNAYSILKTGRDEYGELLPLIFKSFGDYKPGLYIYLTVPFVAVFGLNEAAVRLASSLAGIVSVYLIYLVTLEFFENRKLSIISAFVSAITPWLIYFSRGAWEVNVSLTLTLAGVYLFLKSLHKSKLLIFSSIFFSLTLLTYQGAKLATGIVVVLLVSIYFREIFFKAKRIYLLTALIIGLVIASPIILSIFRGETGRLSIFSIFSYPRPAENLQSFLDEGNEKINSISYNLFHSDSLDYTRGILGRWFNHFSGRFLFFQGDWENPRHSAPNQGVFLVSDIILVIFGLLIVFKNRFSKEMLLVLVWLVLAPLPAILSRDQVHAVRTLNLAVPLILIISLGLKSILESRRKVFQFIFFGFYLSSFVYFLDAYFVHLPAHNSQYWDYGYKQVVETITPIQKNYQVIKVQQSYAQPYIFFLFFQKYDPASYQKQAKLVENLTGDVGQVEHLDNIYFSPIDWSLNRGKHGTLFVADTIRIPLEDSRDTNLFTLIKEIRYLNGRDIAFRIIEVR